jgi:hypothetical protein
MAIVYIHKKPDNEVFYVGIGVTRKRAKSVYGRNKHWHNVVNKFGFSVEILFDDVDYETAKDCERYLIKYYGRRDLGLGTLVNFTDGGEGFANMPEKERLKRSKRMSEYNKNSKDYSFTQKKEYREKMKNSCKGKGFKPVIDTKTNIKYNSLMEASEAFGISISYLSSMLNNKIKNKTSMQWMR